MYRMSDVASHSGDGRPQSRGALLAAISTGIVRVMRENYGRGAMRAKSYVLDDLVVCVLREGGYSPFERTLVDAGRPERVVALRHDFQNTVEGKLRDLVEELADRRVVAFLSQAHLEPELSIEMFMLDRPLDAFGAAELIDPGSD